MNNKKYAMQRLPRHERLPDVDIQSMMAQIIKDDMTSEQTALTADPMDAFVGGADTAVATVPQPTTATIPRFSQRAVYLDSFARDLANSNFSQGYMQWNLSNYFSNREISNVCQIEIPSFYFPRMINNVSRPDYFFYQRVFVQLMGVPNTQVIKGQGGEYFHFECEVLNPNGTAILLKPLKPVITFTQPLTTLDRIGFKFRIPNSPTSFRKINIYDNEITFVSIPNTNPARFTITGSSNMDALSESNGVPTAPGIAVVISDFTSGNKTVDNSMKSNQGLYVTNIVSRTEFEIDRFDFTDGATAPNTTTAFTGTMRIMKNRIGFTMYFTCQDDRATNRITVIA